jgi:hypothetical protein
LSDGASSSEREARALRTVDPMQFLFRTRARRRNLRQAWDELSEFLLSDPPAGVRRARGVGYRSRPPRLVVHMDGGAMRRAVPDSFRGFPVELVTEATTAVSEGVATVRARASKGENRQTG